MINYKSKDPLQDLEDILEDNYWIEELDQSVVKLLFESLADKQSFLDLCAEMYVTKNFKPEMEPGDGEADELVEDALQGLLEKLVGEAKLSIGDKDSFLLALGNNVTLSELAQFPDDVLADIVSSSVSCVSSQIHVLSKIRGTNFVENENLSKKQRQRQKKKQKKQQILANRVVEFPEKQDDSADALTFFEELFPSFDTAMLSSFLAENQNDIQKVLDIMICLNSDAEGDSNETSLFEDDIRSPDLPNSNDLLVLFQMFPSISKETLKSLFDDHGSLEECIASILEKDERDTRLVRLPAQDAVADVPVVHSNDTARSGSNFTMAKLLQFQTLASQFPHVEPEFLHSIFRQCGYDIEKTKAKLPELMDAPRHVALPTQVTDVPKKPSYWNHEMEYTKINHAPTHPKSRTKLRNECYQQAATAFINKEHAKWKIFSDLGKTFDVKSGEQGLLSQKLIFNLDTRSRFIQEVPKIDLHGFYVKNAIQILSRLLAYYKGKCAQGVLVITGVGNHSHGPVKLKPAVYDYLRENKYKFRPENVGSFLVFPE